MTSKLDVATFFTLKQKDCGISYVFSNQLCTCMFNALCVCQLLQLKLKVLSGREPSKLSHMSDIRSGRKMFLILQSSNVALHSF